MTGHLARLALRTTQSMPGLRPRKPALFEQETTAWLVEPNAIQAENDLQAEAVQPVARSGAHHLADPSPDEPRSDNRSPESVSSARSPMAGGFRKDSGVSPSHDLVSEMPSPNDSPARRRQPVDPTANSPRPRPHGLDDGPQDPPNDTPDVAKDGSNSRPSRSALPVRTTGPQLTTQDSFPDSGSARVRFDTADLEADVPIRELREARGLPQETVPANQGPETSSSWSDTRIPGPLSPSVPLPRLQPPSDRERSGAPEVTVTIGRIEVLPAARAVPPPPHVPKPARRATNAPDLGTYLRDRRLQ